MLNLRGKAWWPATLLKRDSNECALRTPILKNICERLFLRLHETLFTMHEKDTTNEASLVHSQTYIMEFFLQKQSTGSSPWLSSEKSSIIDIWHDSKYASKLPRRYLLLQYRWQYSNSLLRDPSKSTKCTA